MMDLLVLNMISLRQNKKIVVKVKSSKDGYESQG